MRRRLARLVHILLCLDDSPAHVALSFAVGVWIAFFPLFGIHTGLALVLAFALRLNRAAILLGAYVNNPWTLAPLYMSGTLVGCALFGVSPARLWNVEWAHTWNPLATLVALQPLLWPFVVGNLLLGTVVSVATYWLMRRVLERRRAKPASPQAGAPSAATPED